MATWEYDCPKFTNLASGSDESIAELEKYFEVDHEEDSKSRRTTRSTTEALAASGDIKAPEAERTEKHHSNRATKAARQLARQKGQEQINLYEDQHSPRDASSLPHSKTAGKVSLPILELKGKENKNMSSKAERAQESGLTLAAVGSIKQKSRTKKNLQANHPPLLKAGRSLAASEMDGANLNVSKPIVRSAVKKSGAALDVKKRIVPLSVRQHAPPSAICKNAAALPVRKVVTPALKKPAALPAAPLQSLAELVGKFHNKTPTRFRRVPKDPGGERHDVVFKKPTIPVTPKLATQLRSRTVSLRDQKRKAEEVNFGVSNPKKPKVEAARVNVRVAPVSKPALHAKKAEQDFLASKLSTKPPQKKLANTATSREVSKRVTIAKSPAFALKLRSETWKHRKQVEQRTLGMHTETIVNKPHGSKGRPHQKPRNPKAMNKDHDWSSSRNGQKQQVATTVVDGVKTQPCRKRETAKGNLLARKKKSSQSNANESIAVASSMQNPSSNDSSQEANKKTNVTATDVKIKSGTKGGSKKGFKPFASVKTIHRASSACSISATIKSLPQKRKEKVCDPAKVCLSGKPQHTETIVNKPHGPKGCPHQKPRNPKAMNKDHDWSSSRNGQKQCPPVRFKAKPAPDSSRVFRLRSTSAPPTKPKPFRLASVERHQEFVLEFDKMKEWLEAERIKKTKFIARPVPRAVRERPKSVDHSAIGKATPGPSGHVSRPRHR